jgi:hypothetical protein
MLSSFQARQPGCRISLHTLRITLLRVTRRTGAPPLKVPAPARSGIMLYSSEECVTPSGAFIPPLSIPSFFTLGTFRYVMPERCIHGQVIARGKAWHWPQGRQSIQVYAAMQRETTVGRVGSGGLCSSCSPPFGKGGSEVFHGKGICGAQLQTLLSCTITRASPTAAPPVPWRCRQTTML